MDYSASWMSVSLSLEIYSEGDVCWHISLVDHQSSLAIFLYLSNDICVHNPSIDILHLVIQTASTSACSSDKIKKISIKSFLHFEYVGGSVGTLLIDLTIYLIHTDCPSSHVTSYTCASLFSFWLYLANMFPLIWARLHSPQRDTFSSLLLIFFGLQSHFREQLSRHRPPQWHWSSHHVFTVTCPVCARTYSTWPQIPKPLACNQCECVCYSECCWPCACANWWATA